MHTTSLPHRPTRRSGRSLAGVLAALAVSGLALVATAAPASATDEFPSKPTASATIGCDDGTSFITLQLGNEDGLDSAHFDVSITGIADAGYDVATGTTSQVLQYGIAENSDVTVAITADDGFTFTKALHADCWSFVGGIVQTCDGTQPVLTANVDAIGTYGDSVDLHVNGTTVDSADLATGDSTSFTAQVPDGVPFTAELVSVHDGTITDLSGTPHCVQPTTTTSTVVPTTPAPTVPTQVVPQQVNAPVAPAPYVAPTELPRTGSSTVPLTVLGVTLVGLGIAARRFAATRRA